MLFARVLLVLLCFNVSLGADGVTNLTTDERVLVKIKIHIMRYSPDTVLISSNWSTSAPVCRWLGVFCGGRHGRVMGLNLSNMGIAGGVPPHIGNLSFLSSLDLSNNSFQGKLPGELSKLRRLQTIELGNNYLHGDIPTWLGTLPKLKQLSLNVNNFTGTIPLSLYNLSNLEVLDLRYNLLQGNIPSEVARLGNLKWFRIRQNNISGIIPRSIYNMSSLQKLDLSHNILTGTLADNMCDFFLNLDWLSISGNELEGQLPLSLGNCGNLQILYLSDNKFSGSIPYTLGNLTNLEELYIGQNNLEGEIPRTLGNLTNLKILYIRENSITGEIPNELSKILGLEIFIAANTRLRGTIPHSIFNLSSLVRLDLSNNSLSGTLPSSFGLGIPNLEILNLWENYLSGVIPYSISNASMLTIIDLGFNRFSGPIPYTLGYLSQLEWINFGDNNFASESKTQELNFLSFLTNCRHLQVLSFSNNPLIGGMLPTSVGNFSTSLQNIYLSNCTLRGQIPREIGSLTGLILLNLEKNELEGSIPTTFGKLKNLQGLSVSHNKLQGSIPYDLCGLNKLYGLLLRANNLEGRIPTCFNKLSSLRELNLSFNSLSSTIPSTFWSLSNILSVDLSSNLLAGNLSSEVEKLKVLTEFDLSNNKLSGALPSSIGSLQQLLYLSLSNNNFQEHIPMSIGGLISLQHLDLSGNNLTGTIPKSLEALKYLGAFNVSFNKLEGQVPTGGSFGNFSAASYMGNFALCGSLKLHMPLCKKTGPTKKSLSQLLLKIILPTIVSVTLMALCVIIFIKRRKQKISLPNEESAIDIVAWRRIPRLEIIQATEGFNETNLLGVGAFGSVYKGLLLDETIVAVKVFNLQVETAFKSFDTETEIFRNVRHRNLVKVISSCSDVDFKALVLEFMPKGSLDKWLYAHNYFLDIVERLNIMIDVAAALEYLHHGYSTPVVHCDLKPSNVLLDENKVAHLSDFGISKLFEEGKTVIETITLATIGYMAPEYGSMGTISTQSDVYSYGILAMETFTRTKPTDEMFGGELTLKSWVKQSLLDPVVEVVDANLLKREEKHFTSEMDCISSILAIACRCSSDVPEERGNMKDVLASFQSIRQKFLNSTREA